MKFSFAEPGLPESGVLILLAGEGRSAPTLGETGKRIEKQWAGAIGRAAREQRFTGKKGKVLSLAAPGKRGVSRLILVGLGKDADLSGETGTLIVEEAGGAVIAALGTTAETEATAIVELPGSSPLEIASVAAHLAAGMRLRSYRFDKYRTRLKAEDKPALSRIVLKVADPAAARRHFAQLDAVLDGVILTRDLVSEPANVLYPESFAAEARKLSRLGLAVEVLDEKKMKALGFGALLGVAQGSARPPRLVIWRWNGGPKTGARARPLAFIGKGVTFDTGGISLKPAKGMESMKWDMGGAGVVAGLMCALARRKARVNAVGIAGMVENMPSGTAQRPGDIVTSMSGQTIEVLNTDAEGRLVLADALWYCQKRFKPRFMIDLATLTGAIIMALGHEHAGLFANDDALAEKLLDAGRKTGERLWRLPLAESYDRLMDSRVADVQNIQSGGGAGSITAAQFLQRFVNDVPWAHLDIAGVTWADADRPLTPRGGSGFGVRLLDRLIRDSFEGA